MILYFLRLFLCIILLLVHSRILGNAFWVMDVGYVLIYVF